MWESLDKKYVRGGEANIMKAVTRDVNDINLCAMVSELNMVDSNPKSWWLDTGATKHICVVRDMFTNFEPAQEGELLSCER